MKSTRKNKTEQFACILINSLSMFMCTVLNWHYLALQPTTDKNFNQCDQIIKNEILRNSKPDIDRS